MRIKEEIKKDGYFWLPSTPDKKVSGTIIISDGGQIKLEVVGLFDTSKIDDNDEIERIIGNIETHGFITLDDCFYTKKNFAFGNIAKSTVCVNKAFVRVAYDDKEDITFNSFQFSIEGIDEWVGQSGIKVESIPEEKSSSITYKLPDNLLFNLNNGMKLTITFSANLPTISNFQKEVKISQKTYFKLTSEYERTLDDFEYIAYKLATFLCFAIDEAVSINEITATSDKVFRELGNGKTIPTSISIYYASLPYTPKEPKITPYRMLFRFNQIAEDAERIINIWIEAWDNITPALSLYFSVKTDSHKYLDGKFLALAQTLETYHRRTSSETLMEESKFKELAEAIVNSCPKEHKEWLSARLQYGNEISLRNRIKNLIIPFSNLLGDAKKTKKLICSIVDTRNYLTHYDKSLETKAASGRDLWVLCCKIEIIFQLHILKVLDFTDERINLILKNNYKIQQKLKED